MELNKKIPKDMAIGSIYSTNNYGDIVIVEYVDSRNVTVEFINTGFVIVKTANSVRNGTIKDVLKPTAYGVGFIGIGKHKTGTNSKPNKKYQTWKGMLERCYCKKCQKKHPTYIGCTVDKEWHNYQNFAKWYDENFKPNLQLDKDKLTNSNKIYSKDTCIFITSQENSEVSLAKTWNFISPYGEHVKIINLAKFCRKNNLNRWQMAAVHNGKTQDTKGWTKYV